MDQKSAVAVKQRNRFWVIGVFCMGLLTALPLACASNTSPAPTASPAATEARTTTPTATSTAPTPTASPTATPAAFTETTKLDVNIGSPGAEDWKWVLGELKTGAEPVTNPPVEHGDAWVFHVVAGTTEISSAGKKDTLSPGGAQLIPAGLTHGHLFAPQTRVLVLQLKDRPPARAHGADVLLVSDKPVDLKAAVATQLRVREFVLSPGGSIPERAIAVSGVGYVVEGTLSSRIGGTASTFASGKAFEWRASVTHDAVNAGTSPVRFLLFDVRQ